MWRNKWFYFSNSKARVRKRKYINEKKDKWIRENYDENDRKKYWALNKNWILWRSIVWASDLFYSIWLDER